MERFNGTDFCTLRWLLFFCCLLGATADNEKCQPFPSGNIAHDVMKRTVMPGDVIRYDFKLSLNLSSSVRRVITNITASSLMFAHNESIDSVTWKMASDGTVFDRNSSQLVYTETMYEDGVHGLMFDNLGGENYTLTGTLNMIVSSIVGAGGLVQSELEVTVIHDDNFTCFTCVGSPYFYLPPSQIWISSDTPLPVPMMGQVHTDVNLVVVEPSVLGPSFIEVRTPSEESSREVILTIQGSSVSQVTGFMESSTQDVLSAETFLRSTFASFQNDVGEIELPPLYRDVVNYSSSQLTIKFAARTEDYSELRDGDVVNVSAAVALGSNGQSHGVDSKQGANLIWVSSMPITLQVPPLDQKKPDLDLSINQKSSCAYDGETRSSVEVKIVHSVNSTATAYNVTARVYLSETMTMIRHVNSELRQNSLSVVLNSSVVYVDIERMTFSDPTTVTLDLDIDLSDPRVRLAKHHVITADAVFSDRWGNSTGMFTAIDYVSLQLDSFCSQRLNWTISSSCTCSHDVTRSDCGCCVMGACQCGDVNPGTCQPCDRLYLCQPRLEGFEAITELAGGDGATTYVCAAYYRYRTWSKGISCYKRTAQSGSYTWSG